MILPILYHSATHLIASDLPIKQQRIYLAIKRDIDRLNIENEQAKKLILSVCKKFIQTDIDLGECHYDESGPVKGGSYAVLKCVVKYLRHLLIDTKIAAIYLRIVCLIDVLVRRGGFTAHWLIGQKRFLQTLSLTARRWKLPGRVSKDPYANDASDVALDCIFAWHEAFYPTRAIFPYYSQTYYKLKLKYHIQFVRPERDPSRHAISFERCDPSSLEEDQDFLFNESIDATEHAYSDAHVSYSVYNHFYENSSFVGAPKTNEEGEMMNTSDIVIDDGTLNTSEAKETAAIEEPLPPFQPAIRKSEGGIKKSVSIVEEPQYFDEMGPIISPLTNNNTPKSFRFQPKYTVYEQQQEKEEEEKEIMRVEEEEREKEREEEKADVVHEEKEEEEKTSHQTEGEEKEEQGVEGAERDDAVSEESPAMLSPEEFPESPQRREFKGEDSSSPYRGNDSSYSIDSSSIRTGTVGERVNLFNTRDSRRSMSNRSIGSAEKEPPVEIKFFGTQRIVVPKRDSLVSH